MHLMKSSYTGPVKAGDISIAQNIPEAYLFKVLGSLKTAGIIMSRRGIYGGYYLAQKPSEITILDIVKATGNSLASTVCLLKDNKCGGIETCTIHKLWKVSNVQIENVLGNISLEVLQKSNDFEIMEPEAVNSDSH